MHLRALCGIYESNLHFPIPRPKHELFKNFISAISRHDHIYRYVINHYLETNELIINLKKGKTECVIFGTAKRISAFEVKDQGLKVYCNNVRINLTTTFTYLGTLLDHHMVLNDDFEKKYRKASSKLGLLRRPLQFLTPETAKLVYSSVMISALRNNCIVNLNLNQTKEQKLKSLERRANVLLKTKTVPIRNAIRKQAAQIVYKCLNGELCSNFQDYFELNQNKMNTRNNNISVRVPRVKLEFARNSFYFMGAKIYNELPREIRASDNFKQQVTQHFK